MIKRGLPGLGGIGGLGGLGGSQPSKTPEELEEEAQAELRRAIGGAAQRNPYGGSRVPPEPEPRPQPRRDDPPPRARREAPPPPDDDDEYEYVYEDEDGDFEPPRRFTAQEEARAVTDYALQQLQDRPQAGYRRQQGGATYGGATSGGGGAGGGGGGAPGVGGGPPLGVGGGVAPGAGIPMGAGGGVPGLGGGGAPGLGGGMGAGGAEEMRNRALADMLERQRRMAAERPPGRPPIVQKISGVNISPSISVRPTIANYKAPVEREMEAAAAIAEGKSAPALDKELTDALRSRKAERDKSLSDFQDAKHSRAAFTRASSGLAPSRGGAANAERRAARQRTMARSGGPSLTHTAILGIVSRTRPPDSLQRVCRWLVDQTDASVGLIMVQSDTIVDVAASPPLSVLARELKHVVRRPLSPQSSAFIALDEERSLSSGSDAMLMLPDGSHAGGCEWLVCPVDYYGEHHGAFILTRREGEVFSETEIDTVEEVAHLMSRVFQGQDLNQPEPEPPERPVEETAEDESPDEAEAGESEAAVAQAAVEAPPAEPAVEAQPAAVEAVEAAPVTDAVESPPVEPPAAAVEAVEAPPAVTPAEAPAPSGASAEAPPTEGKAKDATGGGRRRYGRAAAPQPAPDTPAPAVAAEPVATPPAEPVATPPAEPVATPPAEPVAMPPSGAAKESAPGAAEEAAPSDAAAGPAAAAAVGETPGIAGRQGPVASPAASPAALPVDVWERLVALSFVLGAVGSPAPGLDPERANVYEAIARDAEALRARVGALLEVNSS